MSIEQYETFWDITRNRGGVVLTLEQGNKISLHTQRGNVLRVWLAILRSGNAYYYKSGNKECFCTTWFEFEGLHPPSLPGIGEEDGLMHSPA
ncbi:MAG: hypothetical protein WA957_06510 [Alteraurantiacibacter sp.]